MTNISVIKSAQYIFVVKRRRHVKRLVSMNVELGYVIITASFFVRYVEEGSLESRSFRRKKYAEMVYRRAFNRKRRKLYVN